MPVNTPFTRKKGKSTTRKDNEKLTVRILKAPVAQAAKHIPAKAKAEKV
jgi:hypothetical protein